MLSSGLVIADDLTGATDTGHEFAARGLRTLVSASTAPSDTPSADTDVRVVDTDSRYADPSSAAAAVHDVVGTDDHSFVYKKVDSTLRGNLVGETDAVLDATAADLALVAPASPRNGRTTVEGYHLVDGVPVAETAAGNDPDKPVETSHLPTRYAASSYSVSRLPVNRVATGPAAVADALREQARTGRGIVVADASHERHLEALADGAARSGLNVVYVGSAGLARYVETPPPRGAGPASVPTRDRTVLCVVGSTNPTTLDQLDALPAESVVSLDLDAAVEDPAGASAEAAAACSSRLADRGVAVLVSAPDEDAPRRALDAGRRLGIDDQTVRARVAETLGSTVERLWVGGAPAPESVFVTGGAVAADVFESLDAAGVVLSGTAVEEGIPLGRLSGGVADGTPVVTKAGAFGTPGAIRKCIARLGGDDAYE
ncbi:four-carbon acid sugar kinase family protein [Haloferax denitrificans]|uniref:YgbK domain-containing protein n=1 Tax=Haloferax denitrificans ATCC 35960 TaxID=662478 RepID=M0JDP4_9EURY|nr:four-carbon acid sugar kinase family protein [Haloferax denitrificans]EMA06468.1 ygbK domain-containing protein [Haloferax denitrificans ATCC 35960]